MEEGAASKVLISKCFLAIRAIKIHFLKAKKQMTTQLCHSLWKNDILYYLFSAYCFHSNYLLPHLYDENTTLCRWQEREPGVVHNVCNTILCQWLQSPSLWNIHGGLQCIRSVHSVSVAQVLTTIVMEWKTIVQKNLYLCDTHKESFMTYSSAPCKLFFWQMWNLLYCFVPPV